MLSGKKILIGITGGIAAYKIPILIRLLIKEGAEVKIVMTHEACNFVTPLTLSALSQNPVSIEPFNQADGTWHSHIELGSWADVFLIAPLTANSMAKMATGITDSLLLATYLAARCPVFFAPSMDVDMYHHKTTQHNISVLQSHGNILIAPQSGELASGLTGMGRLEEPAEIVSVVKRYFSIGQSLTNRRVLITSGPTVEPIDPVRFISNYSTGKMGKALAIEAANRGAEVIFVSGPVNDYPEHQNVNIIKVNTAAEMMESCLANFADCDIVIAAAAVADYTPTVKASEKIKKNESTFDLKLSKTVDILAELGRIKTAQLLVGFALETQNELENAKNKLTSKKLDLIILNSLNDAGAGFGFDTNHVKILDAGYQIDDLGLKSKTETASLVFDSIVAKLG